MQAKIAITWLNGDLKAKNKYTRASAIIVSYQWVICIIANLFLNTLLLCLVQFPGGRGATYLNQMGIF